METGWAAQPRRAGSGRGPANPRRASRPARAGGPFPLSVDQIPQTIVAEFLQTGDRVESLEGPLVTKLQSHPPRWITTRTVRLARKPVILAAWYADAHKPSTTGDSDRVPDAWVIRGPTENDPGRRPKPAFEAAAGSMARGTPGRKRTDGAAGFPNDRLANLPERRIEVNSGSTGPHEWPDYRRRTDHAPGDDLPVVVDGAEAGRQAARKLLPKEGT